MGKLQLTFASALYDRMQPIYTGEVPVDGIDLNFIRIEQPRPIFDRMSGGQEFDVAEYSSSEYIQRYANKQCPFVAIPVFPSRCFRHGFIAINKKSGIKTPKDLEGKRIGVALYTMTAAIFIRGILQHEYGVDFSKVKWVQGAINSGGAHGSPTVLPLLKPIDIEQNTSNKSLDDLIQDGTVDATMGTSLPESYRTNPDIARLFPDYVELEKEHYKRTKIYPIMHLVAIKKSIYEKYPFVATSLFNAFQRAKEIALERMYNLRALRYMVPWLPRDVDEIFEIFDGDPWPYGVEENRPTLEALVTYLCDQNLIVKPVALEDLFAPVRGSA
jgi:4,5-dihydroxyphthalate decarboxylase